MIRRIVFWTTFALVLAVGTMARAAESLRIVPITSDDSVVVSVELSDAYNDDIRQAIASGLRTQFTYDIELRMVVPAWIDRTVASAIVNISDQYDNLTRRHTLSRLVDGRVQETITTDDDAVVRQWLTTLTRLPICETSKLDPNRDYYVRIIARSRPYGQSILGLTNSITGQVKFTFIP
jgi:Domain of unknown function (DUF4390)